MSGVEEDGGCSSSRSADTGGVEERVVVVVVRKEWERERGVSKKARNKADEVLRRSCRTYIVCVILSRRVPA